MMKNGARMLSEPDVRERAAYCTCVLLQLGWLLGNSAVHPDRYLEVLRGSSLDLANDPLIASTIDEAAQVHQPDGGLSSLLSFYEGVVFALCEVLQTDLKSLLETIPQDFLDKLAGEVDSRHRSRTRRPDLD